jgi:hypothetical protein
LFVVHLEHPFEHPRVLGAHFDVSCDLAVGREHQIPLLKVERFVKGGVIQIGLLD